MPASGAMEASARLDKAGQQEERALESDALAERLGEVLGPGWDGAALALQDEEEGGGGG